MRRLSNGAVAIAAVFALSACNADGEGKAATSADKSSVAAQPDYHPSLADIMTMAVQPRHTKLGLAAKSRNWPYLAYEVSELRSAFARVARTVPTFRDQDMTALVNSEMKEPIDAMAAAVKARDGEKFDAAYARTTASCNACHTSLAKPFVVIRAPGATSFPDQDFSVQPAAAKPQEVTASGNVPAGK